MLKTSRCLPFVPTIALLATVACGGENRTGVAPTGGTRTGGSATGGSATGGSVATGGSIPADSGTTTVDLPAKVCDEPAPWTPPSGAKTVGNGTAESCTAAALSAAVSSGGMITLDCGPAPITIAVATAIKIGKATVVDGQGRVTLDGGGVAQLFIVNSNTSLSVRNLRFVNGRSPSNQEAAGIGGAVSGNWRSKVEVIGCTFENNTAARGGGAVGVWTGSALTIVGSRFVGNHSWYGGAVYSLLSPLTIVNSVFVDNGTLAEGDGDGGAIGTDGASESPSDTLGGTVQICGTQIRGNQGYGSGGGVYLWVYPPDQVTIDRTTLDGNTVTKKNGTGGALGGAMRISNGTIVIKDSSFLSNTSETNGGALYLDCAPTCAITNSTFHANKTAGYGGALFSGTASGQLSINNSTFVANLQTTTKGNAIFGSATWKVTNSVFVDNPCAATLPGARVLQWSTATNTAGGGPCIAAVLAGDPKLLAPADNGGPTPTMLPGAGSAALQAGSDCEATDQRGKARDPAICDLGAVELP